MNREVRIIMPKEESLHKLTEENLVRFKRGVINLIKYYQEKKIDVFAYSTDEVIFKHFSNSGVKLIQCILPEDRYFLKHIYKETIMPGIDTDEIYNAVRSKYPVRRGMSEEERKSVVDKRIKRVPVEDIKRAGMVVDFGLKNNAQFKVSTKEGDKRMVAKVDLQTLRIDTTMSGIPIDAKYIYTDVNAHSPIDSWTWGDK